MSASELFVGKTITSSKMLRSISFRNITSAPIRVALCPEVSGTVSIYVPRQFAEASLRYDSTATTDAVHPDSSFRASEKSLANRPFRAASNFFAGQARRRSEPKHGHVANHNDEQQLARLQSQLDLATPPSWLGREKKDSTNPKAFQDSPIKRLVRRRMSTLVSIGPVVLNDQGAPLSSTPDDKHSVPLRSDLNRVSNASGSELDLEQLLTIHESFHSSLDPPFFKSCEQESQFVLDKLELSRNCSTLLATSCAQVNDVVLPPGVDVPVILGISAENWYPLLFYPLIICFLDANCFAVVLTLEESWLP